MGFPGGSIVRNSPANVGDTGDTESISEDPLEKDGNPHQCSCLDNSMDRGAWWATVHEQQKSQTGLSTCASVWCAIYINDIHPLCEKSRTGK